MDQPKEMMFVFLEHALSEITLKIEVEDKEMHKLIKTIGEQNENLRNNPQYVYSLVSVG